MPCSCDGNHYFSSSTSSLVGFRIGDEVEEARVSEAATRVYQLGHPACCAEDS